jgi:hypothetical protein
MVKIAQPPPTPAQPAAKPGAQAAGTVQATVALPKVSLGVLVKGQIVNAELIKTLGDNEGLLKIAGRLFRAIHPEGIKPGTVMPLRIVDTGPPLVMKLPDTLESLLAKLVRPSSMGFAKAASQLIATPDGALSDSEATTVLAQLKTLLKLPTNPDDLARALSRFVKGSGVFSEAFMARGEPVQDLKSLIQKLLPFARALGDEALEGRLDALLSHINTHQARSLIDQLVVMPFHLPWGDEPISGELELMGEGDGGEEAGARGLTLRLNMPSLGPVEAALWYGKHGTSITLRFDEKHLDWVAPQLPQLEEALKSRGIEQVSTIRLEAHRAATGPAKSRGLLEILV